jgi:hypothetical protein
VSYRVKRAIRCGWLKNLETRNGHPARLQLGDPLPDDTTALPTVQQVREAFDTLRTPFELAMNQSSSDERGTSSDAFECATAFREGAEPEVTGNPQTAISGADTSAEAAVEPADEVFEL